MPTQGQRAGVPRAGRGVGTLLLCLVVASGCGDDADAPRGATVEVQDSSGVELVSDAQGERLLGLEEVLRVGVLEGDSALQFDRIRSVALDESEGVWVVDSHESVRHYSGSGRFLGSVGSEGSGPGEAQGYGGVWTGDNSVVVSGYPGVLQRFRSDGTLTESTTSSKMGEGGLEILRPIGAGEHDWPGLVFRRESFAQRGYDGPDPPLRYGLLPHRELRSGWHA